MSENPDNIDESPDDIDKFLKNFVDINSDIIGTALFTTNGNIIRAAFAYRVNETLISEISAKIQKNAEKGVEELLLGKLIRILIEGEEGTIILSKVGKNVIMCVIAKRDAKLGMIFLSTQLLTKNLDSKNLNLDEFDKFINKILSIMEEQETNNLTFEKKYLPELLTSEMLRLDTEDGLPIVNYWATIQFGMKGIHIKYYDELAIFVKD